MATAAQFIGDHEAELVHRWFDEASLSASSRGLPRPEFTNIMPKFIAALGHATTDLGEFSADRRNLVESHLATRLRQGFMVGEIVDELLLVGRCVERMSEAERTAGAKVEPAMLPRLWSELNRAAALVADMFTRHMVEDEQGEKRYARFLRTLAQEALQPGSLPFHARLDEALSLIREGVGADSVTLLLHRPATGDLATVASSGIPVMQDYVAKLDLASFVGQVASSPDVTAVADVATTTKEIPESLRRSGLRSLLAIRLPAHHTLAGVLCAGLCETRSFSARESGRLEALGEQLTLHLEYASLVGELNEKVAALESERDLRARFVSVLAHDLRGPLAAATMAAGLLASPSVDEERRSKMARRVERSIGRADRMVRDLLDANRIHAGEPLALRLADCDLAEIARTTVEELVEIHGPRFVLVGEAHVLGVWAEDEVRRALWNLAVNAVKYGDEGAPITVRVASEGDRATLSVHNVGHPIPAEEQPRLFTAFARSRAAVAGGARGWGLGLTLVRGAAEAHGGRVTLTSDEATGTTFTLDLPRDARAHRPTAPGVPL